MGRDTIQLEGAVSTISGEYLLEFTSEYGILENLHPEVPSLGETIVDFPKGKVDEKIFPTYVDWRASAPRDEMPIAGFYFAADVTLLNTDRAPFQRLPENLLCLVGLSRNYYLGDDVYPTFLYDDDQEMDLFILIRNPNPFKINTGTRPRAAHEVPLLTAMAIRVIAIEDPTVASGSSGTPSTVERSPLDFDNKDPTPSLAEGAGAEEHVQEGSATTTEDVQEAVHEEEVAATEPPVNKRRKQMRRKRVNEEAEANALPKALRKDHASGTAHSTHRGKSLAVMGLDAGSTFSLPAAQNTSTTVSDPEPLSYAKPQPHPVQDIAQSSKGAAAEIPTEDVATTKVNVQLSMRSPNLGKSTSPSIGGSPELPPGYFSELCHLHNMEFLSQYNMNLARQVAMGLQLRLRFEQEIPQDRGIKDAFEEFKKSEDEKVEQRCAEMDARLDALSIDFDKELYPHMLTAIAGRRWVIRRGLRLAIMNYEESTELGQAFADVVSARIVKGMSEGLKYGIEHGEAKLDLAAIEAYDPEAEAKYVAALTALRDLKYPLVDQLEKLRDAPIDLLMASLHLESNYGEEAPEWICELRPSTSQLKVPIYPEVSNPRDPWSVQEEVLLEDAIAANRSRAEKKKKCRVVCRTHGVGFAHHAKSDDIPVLAPTVAPQGLAIQLANAAVQTEASEDEASPRLLRSKSLPPMYYLDWP
ncbi:hypothetical protein Tco_1237971 [Tanacetum coccineum]